MALSTKYTAIFGLLAIAAIGGCKGGKVDPVPKELVGDWQGNEESDHRITISRSGIASSGIICDQNHTFKSLSCSGTDCNWESKGAKGTFTYDASTKKLTLQTEGSGGCHDQGLTGTVSKVDEAANKLPANLQGTWYACDNPKCGRVKLLLTETGVTVSGTGGKCISDDAKVKSVNADGPKVKVKHDGLESSGWDFTILTSTKGFEVIGADTLKGNYAKDECTPGQPGVAPTAAAAATSDERPSSGSGKACEDYVTCVCDLSDAISKSGKGEALGAADCDEVKKAYGALGSMGANDTCKKMLDTYKETLGKTKSLYEMSGIRIPSSCK